MAARNDDKYRGDTENKGFWTIDFGRSPVIGTAIHDGHFIRSDIASLMALSPEQRLREEDPFTGEMIAGLTNRLVVHHSRFEIDLNRAADQAIYLKPEQSWGLRCGARSHRKTLFAIHSISMRIITRCLRAFSRPSSGGMGLSWYWMCTATITAARVPASRRLPRRKHRISISARFPWIAAAGTMSSVRWDSISHPRPLAAAASMCARTWPFRARGTDPLHP